MLGKCFEKEAEKNNKYYKVIQMEERYSDNRFFPIDEPVISDKKVNLNAEGPKEMGGFCISTYEYIFRWLVRGDTLCEVKIPEDSKIYKTGSENGIYVSEKIILTNPKRITDEFALELYLNSKLPEKSYFKAMAACAIRGYINTAIKVCKDKVNKENIDIAMFEFEEFCKRREDENMIKNSLAIENIKILNEELKRIKQKV